MSHLYFQKLSKYDRKREPVTVSIPFAQGRLTASDQLRIWDDNARLPIQTRALAHWPDGSTKWLLVHLQPDLPGNRDKTLRFDIAPREATEPMPHTPVKAVEAPGGIIVGTGPLVFVVRRLGFLPLSGVQLDGEPFGNADAFSGFTLKCDG